MELMSVLSKTIFKIWLICNKNKNQCLYVFVTLVSIRKKQGKRE